ncbi:hypothetical protein DFAR_660011 [Desulfarculales bacterium]
MAKLAVIHGPYLRAVLAVGLGGELTARLTPLVEMALSYTTHICFMELANLNHPALQELMLQAPGTYHHSLVEAAAKEIGADHLLAKVAAL